MSNFKLGGHVSVSRNGFISEIISDDSFKVTFEDGTTAVVAVSEVVKRCVCSKWAQPPTEVPTKMVCADGAVEYRLPNGKLHNEDGPAVIWPSGRQEYWVDGKLHREDGPAIIFSDGREEYWLNDQEYTKEEFEFLSS